MNQSTFFTRGLRVGRLFGIEIWVHWILLVLLVLGALMTWRNSEGDLWGLLLMAAITASLLLSILLHEFGHCYAAYRMGGGARSVILWPLGGLAECDYPQIPRAQFWVSIGGPLVNLGLAIVFSAVYLLPDPVPGSAAFYGFRIAEYVVELNLFLLVFNLLPIYPLDGGKVFLAAAWHRTGSLGKAGWLTVVTTRIAIPTAIVLGIFARILQIEFLFIFGGIFMIFILVWCWLETEKFRQRLHELEEDHLFGYNFSQGYTSLEQSGPAGGSPRERRPSWRERWKQRRLAREAEERAEMREEVDRLLDKISREGMASLSRRERQYLEVASRKLQEDSRTS